MSIKLQGRVIIDGEVEGELLLLSQPISFWGGVDPATGIICQPAHPQYQQSIAGKILALPGTIGSSSSSAVMLELLYGNNAPLGLLLQTPDAILSLGVIVSREMNYGDLPIIECDLSQLSNGMKVSIKADGHLEGTL